MPLRKQALTKPVFHALSVREQASPILAMEDFFDFADMEDARQLLWQWLKTTVTGTYHKELNASERTAILTLYEKTAKLIEASFLLQQQKRPVHKQQRIAAVRKAGAKGKK